MPNFIQDKKVDFQWQPKTRTVNTLYPTLFDSLFEAFYLRCGVYSSCLSKCGKLQVIRVENKTLLGVFAMVSMDKVMGMKAQMRQLGMRVGVLANFYGERLVVETVV